MSKRIYLIIFLLTCKFCDAQNLIPNGDFEQYTNCPFGISQFQGYVSDWINPQTGSANGTPDYYNQCDTGNAGVPSNTPGWQYAYGGGAYAGLVIAREMNNQDFREYPEIMLVSPLVANACYHFEMYMSLAEISQYTSDDIGVYFSNTAITGISSTGPLPYTPQIINMAGNYPDTATWIKVMGDYTANGNENYLLIGNFKNSANTNTVLINNTSNNPIAYVYIDSVSLTICTTGLKEEQQEGSINLFPNPVTDKLHISVYNNEFYEIVMYDIESRKLLQQNFITSTILNIDELEKGIYLYEVRNKNGVIKKGKIVKE